MSEVTIDQVVTVMHCDGWGYGVEMIDEGLVKITYLEKKDSTINSRESIEISTLVAKSLCEAIRIVAQQDELSDFNTSKET